MARSWISERGLISVWPHIFLYNYLSGRIFEDEIGSVKKKAMFAILVFTLATSEIVLKEKKTARRQEPITLGLRGLFW